MNSDSKNSAKFVKCDVTSWDDITNAFQNALAFSPEDTVDIVIPNAGIAAADLHYWLSNTQYDRSKPETKIPPPPPQKVVNINYNAVFNTVHAAIWYFKNFPGTDLSYSKNIVFVSSMGGYNHMPGSTSYNSSKWGVRGLFWSLRNIENLLGEGKPAFRANLIAPTYVSTNMTKGIKERVKASDSPLKVAEVSDVAHVVMRMVSDEGVKGMWELVYFFHKNKETNMRRTCGSYYSGQAELRPL
jgi:NAD(P)-dependent dehydrogenase (short-subunit alcohol dehydrogenase family)